MTGTGRADWSRLPDPCFPIYLSASCAQPHARFTSMHPTPKIKNPPPPQTSPPLHVLSLDSPHKPQLKSFIDYPHVSRCVIPARSIKMLAKLHTKSTLKGEYLFAAWQVSVEYKVDIQLIRHDKQFGVLIQVK